MLAAPTIDHAPPSAPVTSTTVDPAGRLRIRTPRSFLPLLNPSRYKGVHGGRGAAKSHAFGDLLIERCTLVPGTRAVCIREVQRSLEQSVKRLLEDKLKVYGLGLRNGWRVRHTHLDTPGDGIIIFQGMQAHTAESIKSLEAYDIAWVEEAQSLSQRSLDLLRPTIRAAGSELWFSWNPKSPTDPVDVLLRSDSPPPDSIVLHATYRDNPWFPEVLRREMEWDRGRDPDKYAHVWLGDYERKSEARVFKNWRVEEFETPADATFYYGGDWGYSIDPAVLVRCYFVGRTLYVDYEAYRIGCEIDHIPDLFDKVPGARDWPVKADSQRPDTISYLQRHGFPRMAAAKKGAGSVKDGVIFLQNFDIVIHPRCTHTIDEFTFYSFKTDALTGMVTPYLEDKKNHVIDSLRYAVEDVMLAGVNFEVGSLTW